MTKSSQKKTKAPIRAAGTVIYRHTATGELEVCIIHRPRYNDWSWPKGKLKPHESLAHAAVRETAEETGYDVVLHTPASLVSYVLGSKGEDGISAAQQLPQRIVKQAGRRKEVTYWTAFLADSTQRENRAATFGEPIHLTKDETDAVRWVSIPEAISLLTRQDDKDIAQHFSEHFDASLTTRSLADAATLILIRNAQTVSKKEWDGDDTARPLSPLGVAQAYALTKELSAYMPEHLYATNSVRAKSTAAPWLAMARTQPLAADSCEDLYDAASFSHSGTQSSTQSGERSDERLYSQSDAQPASLRNKHTAHAQAHTDTSDFTHLLGEVMEHLLSAPRTTAALVGTKKELSQAYTLLAPFTHDDAVLASLQDALGATPSASTMKPGHGVALTIAAAHDMPLGCVITHVTKVEPIVF